jgi:hypothetical protein
MTLILRPIGRGNWRTTRMQIDGGHALPLLFRVGERLPMGGLIFRICEVIA